MVADWQSLVNLILERAITRVGRAMTCVMVRERINIDGQGLGATAFQ